MDADLQALCDAKDGEMYKMQAEIERLRGLVYAVPPTENTTGQTWKDACEANREEVARLRAELAKPFAYCTEPRSEILRRQQEEIERLRRAFEQERHDCINLTEKVIPNLRAEIDGVKYTMAYEQSRSETLQAEIKALKAENERLRDALEAVTTVEGNIIATDAAKTAEIERLRISVADFKQFAEAAHRATDERDAEIERLRMVTAPGSCECSPEEACRYARERDEARAENERLRKLVQEALNGPGWMDEHWRDAAEAAL